MVEWKLQDRNWDGCEFEENYLNFVIMGPSINDVTVLGGVSDL